MLRSLFLAMALVSSLLLIQATVFGQEADLPVAGPDEFILVGEVPAPPGTEVRAEYMPSPGPEIIVCGTALADSNSRFVLSIDTNCSLGYVGPLICWAEGMDSCQGFGILSRGLEDGVGPGDTRDIGLLDADAPAELPDGPITIPHGDVGPQIALPATGLGTEPGGRPGAPWLLIIGATLLVVGISAGSLAFLRS